MSSLLNTYDRVLAILNEEMGSSFERLDEAYSAMRRRVLDAAAIGVCGYPCMGDCRTCLEAVANLEAFFAPEAPAPVATAAIASASVEGSGPSRAEAEEGAVEVGDEDRTLENMRSLDLVEEMYRDPHRYDDGYDDGYDEDAYYDDRDDYEDDGGGLDWNESGYFD